MISIADSAAEVSPAVRAGLLLAARAVARRFPLAQPSVEAVFAATSAGRSRAYERRDEILALLRTLDHAPGRPAAAPPTPPETPTASVTREMLRFVMDHPGCVSRGPERRRYSDVARCFVVDLRARHDDVALVAFCEALAVPLETVEDWLRAPTQPSPAAAPAAGNDEAADPRQPQMETVLAEWRAWHGSFVDFCEYVKHELRIPFGHTVIAELLALHGLRRGRKRPGRSPDEKALRKSMETFFPGAQWVGDGTTVSVDVWGRRFTFNVELMVDTDAAAWVGAEVSREEDAQAVIDTFHDGATTTSGAPIAVMLDHRACNSTDEVREALGDTLLMHNTPGRPQNDAHVEGAFGLFAQKAPPLVITARDPRGIARELLRLTVATFGRVLNHRPRADRGGRSRVELYREATPTPEERARARAALAERLRRQRLAEETRRARLDPVVRNAIEDACARLGLSDATDNVKDAIARYALDHVLAAIAVFEGKREAGTLPEGVGARYLLGIARNITQEDEGLHIAEALWRARLAARDYALAQLEKAHIAMREAASDPPGLMRRLVDIALAADRRIDRLYWLQAVADAIASRPAGEHEALFRAAARRIHATYAVPYGERLAVARHLAAKVLPIT